MCTVNALIPSYQQGLWLTWLLYMYMYIVAIHVHVHVYGNEYVHLHDKVYYSVDLPNWSSSLSICHN